MQVKLDEGLAVGDETGAVVELDGAGGEDGDVLVGTGVGEPDGVEVTVGVLETVGAGDAVAVGVEFAHVTVITVGLTAA